MATAKILGSVLLVLFVFCITETEAGEYCYEYGGSYFKHYSTYCAYGCCGSTYDQYCCGADVWIIVLGVIGGIIFVSIMVALICCCIKKQSHTGRVVHPTPNARPNASHVTVVYTGNSGQYPGAYPPGAAGQYPGAYPPGAAGGATAMGPPPYKQFDNPPPAYNYNPPGAHSDPAYPPTNPAYPPSAPAGAAAASSFSATNTTPTGFNANGPSTSSAAPSTTNFPPLPPQ